MKTGFFDEAPGVQSWIRLAGSYLLLLAGFIIVNGILKNKEIDFVLISFLIGTAITGKLVQKVSENKPTQNDNKPA
jgi:hypothetical protein